MTDRPEPITDAELAQMEADVWRNPLSPAPSYVTRLIAEVRALRAAVPPPSENLRYAAQRVVEVYREGSEYDEDGSRLCGAINELDRVAAPVPPGEDNNG